jgi:hypothetical protein
MFHICPSRNGTRETPASNRREAAMDIASAAPKRVSTGEAMRRLADKKGAPAYKSPRGNQETDKRALEYERRRLESVLG